MGVLALVPWGVRGLYEAPAIEHEASYSAKEIELELTRTNTNPNDTEANAAGRSGNARALRKQSKCGVHHEGGGALAKIFANIAKKSEAFVGSAHSAETIKRKAHERSS